MEMPKPGEVHEKLQRLAGSWSGEEKMYPSPWDPKGGTALGRVRNRLALNGFHVVQEYEQERDGSITFQGHAVFGFDPAQQAYTCHWFDSMGAPPNEFKGSFEGDVLSMTCRNPQGWNRAVYAFKGDDHYGFRMEVSGDGEQWQVFMEGEYARE